MARIVADISMSLDGFVTGPDRDLEHGLGHGGEALHGWAFCRDDPIDAQVRPPAFVVTHTAPASIRLATQFTIVTAGLEAAISRAAAAAGDRNVVIMGGADVVRQAAQQRFADELRIHLVPLLLGSGTSLFDRGELQQLVQARVRVSSRATHLTYRIGERGTR